MEKMSNETALDHLDAMLNKTAAYKTAADSMLAVDDKDQVTKTVAGEGAAVTVEAEKVKQGPDKDKDPTQSVENNPAERGMLEAPNDGIANVATVAANTDANAGTGSEIPTQDVESVDNMESITKKSKELTMGNASRVIAAAKQHLNKTASEDGLEKLSAAEFEILEKLSAEDIHAIMIWKEAAANQLRDHLIGQTLGQFKRASDEAALMKEAGIGQEEAAAAIDAAVAEDPSIALEGMEGSELPLENELDQLTEEDIQTLEAIVQELDEQNIDPEELIAAAAAEGVGEEVPEEQEEQEEGLENLAAERLNILGSLFRK